MTKKPRNPTKSIFVITVLFSLGLFLLFTYLFAFRGSPISASKPIDPSMFGQYGDVVGGIVGTVITFLSVYLIYETFKSQKEELEATQIALYDQKNESAFFSMLTTLREIVNEMEGSVATSDAGYGSKETSCKGREYLNNVVKELKDTFAYHELNESLTLDIETGNLHEYDEKRTGVFNEHGNQGVERITRSHPSIPIASTREEIENGCARFFEKHEHNLDHYFRFIESLIDFIREIEYKEDKIRYFRILGAQMSQGEMVLLFYHSLSVKPNLQLALDKWKLLQPIRNSQSLVDHWHHWHFPNTDFEFLGDYNTELKRTYRKKYLGKKD
jgi:hypothetical protein